MRIERYRPELAEEWNEFIASSRNGTFLFNRNYMDYHSDRFQDNSLILRNKENRIIAVLPANRVGDTLYSHQGLTYGGWVLAYRHINPVIMLEGWNLMTEYLKGENIKKLDYRPVPHIFHSYPAEEDIYALFRNGGKMTDCLVSTTIDMANPIPFNRSTRHALREADSLKPVIKESDRYSEFWKILETRLDNKYQSAPVHSIEEIERLHSLFPDNIRLYVAEVSGEIIAGVVIYYVGPTYHCQYIAATEKGHASGAHSAIIRHILSNLPAKVRYFDFGTSNEPAPKYLNNGLLENKAGFGGRTVIYPRFEINL